MDPWRVDDTTPRTTTGVSLLENKSIIGLLSVVDLGESLGSGSRPDAFEDNFIPSESHQYQKLPDSQVYLASLETKLKGIQLVSGKEGKGKEILKSLGENRESCMLNFLSSDSDTVEGVQFDDLKVNPLLKKIQPEKQALSAEELIQLVKADQLATTEKETETESVENQIQEN